MHNQPQEVQGPPVIRLATFLRRVLVYVRPYRMQSLLLIVGMLLDLLFDTALRLSFKFLIDEALIPQNYSLLLSLLAGLSSGIVIAAIAAVGRDYLYARLGTRVVNDLRPPCLPICIAAGAFLIFNGRLSVGALVSFHVLFVSVS